MMTFGSLMKWGPQKWLVGRKPSRKNAVSFETGNANLAQTT